MTARTIVGSGPRRRPLPLEREAVERALRMCEFWGQPAPWQATVMAGAFSTVHRGPRRGPIPREFLPADLRRETPEQLRERLRGYP
jgi:hypothetical protein